MHPDSVPERPLQPVLGRLEPQARVFFFERDDRSVIAVQEKEAWNLIAHPPQVLGQYTSRPRFLGSSDGKLYRDAVAKAQQMFIEGGKTLACLAECQKVMREAEAAELAVARGNMVQPRNADRMDRRGNPINLETKFL